MGLVRQAARGQSRLRRHIPPALFLIGLTILAISLARPQTVVSLPRVEGTVILTFDVSGSMAADDMKPNRMEAAKVAARSFVERQPVTVQIGIVAFSDGGLAVQPPTNDKDALLAAINRLAPARGTSLANGIFVALDAIAKANQKEITNYYSNQSPGPTPTPTPMPPGVFTPAAIILLTDGENTVSPDPLAAAQVAVEQGVRIYTVGVGSPQGAVLNVEGFSVHTQLDEPTLQAISGMTSGAYYNAQNEEDLRKIYDTLGSHLVIEPEETEVTSLFAGVGALFLLMGGALSLLWFGRVP
jgi:Ca-activated chloride channel family protein